MKLRVVQKAINSFIPLIVDDEDRIALSESNISVIRERETIVFDMLYFRKCFLVWVSSKNEIDKNGH